jgi:hypothetical protein
MVAILHPLGPGTQIPIDRAVVLVGRSPECDLVLDISTKISRLHCALIQVDRGYYIRDLGSMNVVMVAGKRVEKECRLVNGQEVTIGDVKYLFLENVVPAPKPARAVNGAKGRPILIDEQAEVVDVVDTGPVPTIRNTRSSNASQSKSLKSAPKPVGGLPKVAGVPEAEIIDVDEAIVVDADVVELVEDFAELVEEVEVLDDAEIPDLVELVDEDEIIEDVEVVDPGPERPKSPRRNR